jgi:hypothetical protein
VSLLVLAPLLQRPNQLLQWLFVVDVTAVLILSRDVVIATLQITHADARRRLLLTDLRRIDDFYSHAFRRRAVSRCRRRLRPTQHVARPLGRIWVTRVIGHGVMSSTTAGQDVGDAAGADLLLLPKRRQLLLAVS